MADEKFLGILFGVGAGFIWAVEAVIGKAMLQYLTYIQVAATEAFFATITALVYSVFRRKSIKLNFTRVNVWNLLVVGLVGTVFAPLMFFFGLTQTLAVNATLLAHLQPLFVSILGFYFLKEKVHKHDFFASFFVFFCCNLDYK